MMLLSRVFAVRRAVETGSCNIHVAALCALSVVCYALAQETYRKDIYAEDPQERKLVAEQG